MKQEPNFPLEYANWPAFLVDEAGTLRRANASAQSVFGPVMEGGSSLLAAIWTPGAAGGEETAGQFLARLARAPASEVKLRLRIKGGATALFDTNICAFTGEGQRFFLFQLTRSEPAPPTTIPLAPATDPSGLAQKQKLDCALQLARTVALDFNNALTIILGHVSLILSKIEPDHPWRTALMEVEKSAERAAEIAHDLAAFSRQEKDARTQITGNLNEVLRHTVEMFQASTGSQLTWRLQLEPRLQSVTFDEAKIQQAFAKIFDNAVQALGPTGCIEIHSSNTASPGTHASQPEQSVPGHHVSVTIHDNGPGIPAAIMPRIFEPFFTTKASHRGLGLAWVYGIITNHGGSVSITCPPEGGTTVHISLPAQKRIVREPLPRKDDLHGNQTILMVDDEDLMLTMGQTILAAYGYRVLTANNGTRALEIHGAASPPIDLIITDMVMPQMSGRELIEILRFRDPSVRVLCTSGYIRPTATDTDTYLQKPFTSQELVRKVREALGKVD